MSGPAQFRAELITDRRQLVAFLEAGCKPKSEWRIGTEHEKFVFRLSDRRRVPFDGADGIQAVLMGLTRYGWTPVRENDNVIALSKDNCAVTLEPGGQLELSGAPLSSLHETCAEVHQHLKEVKAVGEELGVGFLGAGFDPLWRREDVPWMPKGRYRIMRDYMPKKGRLGLDMMLRTCTVQVNLDYGSEADMVKKFRVGLALQPVATALFANSPFTEGKPNGFLSLRSHVWTETDPDRTGILPFVFEPGMGFERYVDYVLDVPMYFVFRDGAYVDVSGQSFRDFIARELPGLPGVAPSLSDWMDHMTTPFPEVRAKQFLEMRGADGGPWRSLCALPALWTGLVYDSGALDAAWDMVKDWSAEEHRALRAGVPRAGLKSRLRGKALRDYARETLAIARGGLEARRRLNAANEDEQHFLEPLDEIVASGRSPAEVALEAYETRWGRSVEPLYRECMY